MTTAVAAAALLAAAGCGTATEGADKGRAPAAAKRPTGGASTAKGEGPRAEATGEGPHGTAEGAGPGSAGTARLVGRALDATFAQKYFTAIRVTESDGTTVLRNAVHDGRAECDVRARKGEGTLDFVVTASALYSRGSKEALSLSPRAAQEPTRVAVMADRWVRRNSATYEVMRAMCQAKTQRTWLEERMPSPANSPVRSRYGARRCCTGGPPPGSRTNWAGRR
ncbi:hypothetical protein [Streptomyces sp. G45]|uniref:hypothetical protein n=1 Tax=Streptomyces sp. G45 TaxID=3406627 RepID=UPI003C1A024E